MNPTDHNYQPRPFSTLPTFHPTRMELTRQAAEARLGTAEELAAYRATWLQARGL